MKHLTPKKAANIAAQATINVARSAMFVSIKAPAIVAGEMSDFAEASLRKLSETSHIKLGGEKDIVKKSVRQYYQDVHDNVGIISKVLDGRATGKDVLASCLGHLSAEDADKLMQSMGYESNINPQTS